MIVIGEKINATRKSVAVAIKERDEAAIAGLVKEQDAAGADVIDLNAGTGRGDGTTAIEDMKWLIEIALENTDKPLALDSEQGQVIETALESVSGRTAWINSISAEAKRLESVMPLANRYSCPVVALCMGDDGIPKDVAGRLKSAEKIYSRAVEAGVDPANLYFDPLVMPIATDATAGKTTLESIEAIKSSFPGVKTVLGLSNVSFGLPLRAVLNAAFLVLCMGAGLDAAILDPCNGKLMMELHAAEALLGKDAYCQRYIGAYRKQSKQEGEKKNGTAL